jgi:uncharacterized protein (TIGR02145 family)
MRHENPLFLALILLVSGTAALKAQTVKDVEGNVYKTVILGGHDVMAENLRTTHFSNGDTIATTVPSTLDISAATAPIYQWAYDGDEKNVPSYGRLYTWYAISDLRNVCPTGWHIPDNDEWFTIAGRFGGQHIVWRKFKGIFGWKDPNAGAITEEEFSGTPAGGRSDFGEFDYMGIYGNWWSSTSIDPLNAHQLKQRGYIYGGVVKNTYLKNYACSVRCVRDN